MKIKETDLFESFELVKDSADSFAFVYGETDIGFDVEQAAQLLAAMQAIVNG